MLPFPEMGGQCRGLFVQGFEIPVVGDLPPGDPPDALDGVQLGGIGREKASRESVPVAFEEGLQRARPVPARVVQYKVNAPASPVEQALKEVMEGLRVESGGRPGEEPTGAKLQRAKEADLLPGRGGTDAGLLSPDGPHAGDRAVAVKVDFVFAPEAYARVVDPPVVVFLKASCRRGSAS